MQALLTPRVHACARRYGGLDEWNAAPRRAAAAADAAAAVAPSSEAAAPRQVSSLLASAVGALPPAPRPAVAVKPAVAMDAAAGLPLASVDVEPTWARERVFDESAACVLAALVRAAGTATVGAVGTKEEKRARPLPFNTVRACSRWLEVVRVNTAGLRYLVIPPLR